MCALRVAQEWEVCKIHFPTAATHARTHRFNYTITFSELFVTCHSSYNINMQFPPFLF